MKGNHRHSFSSHESVKWLTSVFERVNSTLARQEILNEVVDTVRAQCFATGNEMKASCVLLAIFFKNMDIFYPSNREVG